jgi:hypothetical protein
MFSKSTVPLRVKDPSKLTYNLENPYPLSYCVKGKVEAFFEPPVAVELKGGGFEKRNGTWSLRGPRLTKIWDGERTWMETVSYQDFEVG